MRSRALLLLLTIFVALGANAAPEVPLSTPAYEAAAGDQFQAAVATNGRGYLTVWRDERPASGLYAARLSTTGELLDRTGIRLTAGYAVTTGVAWSGNAYTIAWTEQVFAGFTQRYDILYARVDAEGRVVTPATLLTRGAHPGSRQWIAGSPTAVAIVYHASAMDGLTPAAVLASVLTSEGEILRRDVPLPAANTTRNGAAVASNGSEFLVTWSEGADSPGIVAVRIANDGTLIDARQRVVASGSSTDYGTLSAADDAGNWLVGFRERDVTGRNNVLSVRSLSRDFSTLGTVRGIPIVTYESQSSLQWAGSHFVMVWQATDVATSIVSIDAIRLGRDGTPLDERPTRLHVVDSRGLIPLPSLAASGREALLVWNEARFGGRYGVYDVVAARVAADVLSTSAPTLVTFSARPQLTPEAASGTRNHLVVWEEQNAIFGARLTPDGRPLDREPLRISPATEFATRPQVVFDGANFVVLWSTQSSINLTRVTPDGEVLDPVRIANCGDADITANGDGIAVVRTICNDRVLAVETFDRDLRLTSVPRAIAAGNPSNPHIAWNGREYLIAYDELVPGPSILLPPSVAYRANARAIRLTADLVPLETIDVAVSDSLDQPNAGVASNGNDFLVIWQSGDEIRGRRIGVDAEPFTIAHGVANDLLWDGRRYVVAFSMGDRDVLLTHVGAGDRIAIATSGDIERHAALLRLTDGEVAAVYERVPVDAVYGGVSRVFFRMIETARPRPSRVR